MKVKVFHTAFEDKPVHIATVDAPHAVHTEACEYAYRWTQNIMDSWSHPEGVQDKNPHVEVVVPVEKYGHRSSAMGDYFEADGALYKCAAVGFKAAEKIECGQPF